MKGSRWFFGITLIACAALCAGEAAPKPPLRAEEAPAKPRDLEEVIDSIPKVPLDNGVFLQSGEIKIPTSAIEKVELAYAATEKRKNEKFTMSPETRSYMRKRFAFRFLANAVVEKYVADNKLSMPKEQFEEEFQKFKNSKKEEDAGSYEQWLADNGLNDEDFRKFWMANWTIEQTFAKTITDEDVAKSLEKFADGLGLRQASHILIMNRGEERIQLNTLRSKEDAKKIAEGLIAKLKAGEDFGRLAKANSDCPSKAQGGSLGGVSRKGGPTEVFGPVFADAVYKMEKPGDISQTPVESKFGFHIIRLDQVRKPEDLKNDMRQFLVSEKYRKQMEQLMNSAVAAAQFNEKQL
jgi:parvulin-like peptidyl-prolyl isomerase